ncbi:hypothetical protein DFH07DRAFT_783482 [Mycena maculata]|uniref:Uncharacterized protein n=1 Tax=Mycena maculata TaxID=230809 RepID=A0AAD7HLY6_9AGAR|nr:hypothetical protein DFH07DRAFT_783482 [Mycena maculata]
MQMRAFRLQVFFALLALAICTYIPLPTMSELRPAILFGPREFTHGSPAAPEVLSSDPPGPGPSSPKDDEKPKLNGGKRSCIHGQNPAPNRTGYFCIILWTKISYHHMRVRPFRLWVLFCLLVPSLGVNDFNTDETIMMDTREGRRAAKFEGPRKYVCDHVEAFKA